MGISFTVVFLCENVQLALMASPRIATAAEKSALLKQYLAKKGCQEPLKGEVEWGKLYIAHLNKLCFLTQCLIPPMNRYKKLFIVDIKFMITSALKQLSVNS